MRQERKLIIFKDIEMELTANGEVTNDSLSNAIDLFYILKIG